MFAGAKGICSSLVAVVITVVKGIRQYVNVVN